MNITIEEFVSAIEGFRAETEKDFRKRIENLEKQMIDLKCKLYETQKEVKKK